MSGVHALGYSKSSRAKCNGPPPCKGTPLPPGTLRYGHTSQQEYGETVEWRHWGCVTPVILAQLATVTTDSLSGFQELRPSDQQKIRVAIATGYVETSDIPASARPIETSISSQKRRADFDAVTPTETSDEPHEEAVGEQESKDEIYCVLPTSVVGIQYYNGMVGPGEEVLLVREPTNRYDRNAIQVKNIGQQQVGHLPRNVALKLAPLLDRQVVTVEGTMNEGNLSGRSGYTLSITLKIFGPTEKRSELEPQLVWATPGQRGFPSRVGKAGNQGGIPGRSSVPGPASSSSKPPPSVPVGMSPKTQQQSARQREEALKNAAELTQILAKLEKVDDEGRRSSLLDSLCSNTDILNLPLHPDPPSVQNGKLTVNLLKHQTQALQWAIEREYPTLPKKEVDSPVQFWQLRKVGNKPYYYNIATKTPQEAPPVLGRGALCGDAMGLGKTLTMISLVLATQSDRPKDFSNATLIVAPLSVLSNWEKQLQDHCTPGSLTSCVYYGSSRTMAAEELAKFDVVITTYQTVTGEHTDIKAPSSSKRRKTERNLFDIKWKRIILDEGHTIRNPKTKTAQAMYALYAERRWVLTGTPIINSPNDLGSILTFLRICHPLDNPDLFKRLLIRPLKDGQAVGVELLKALMSHTCIRRTKEMQDSEGNHLIPLPPLEMIVVPVALSQEARALYDKVEAISKQRFQDSLQGGVNPIIQANVLSMLTRLRQLALHPALIPKNYLQDLDNSHGPINESPTVAVTPEEIARLRLMLAQAIEECEECPICFSTLNDARITRCAHRFCFACITEVTSRDAKCPMDRRPLTPNELFEPLPPTDLTQRPWHPDGTPDKATACAGSSSKIDQLVHLLRLTPPTEKSLVFSQFTSFLDKIAETLDAERIPFVRFDGQMSAKRRQETIAQFSTPALDPFQDSENSNTVNPRVMLISLKAGALGLNLTVANNVYLMDPWWQEGIESQAVDRVNRIGQTKPVHVYQLIAENTVESKVIEIQARKKKLIQQAFSGNNSRETQLQKREARLQDLIELFGIRAQK